MFQHSRLTRRSFGNSLGLGASAIALESLLASERSTGGQASIRPASAQAVIFLFMSGGPSQVDTFDPKPILGQLGGQDVPPSIAEQVPKIKRAGLRNLLPSPWQFQLHGESGLPISELLPGIAQHADQLCVIRSMSHRNPVHGPGECVALTGSARGDRPSLGAWSTYGLGSLNNSLPTFVTMNVHTDGMQFPQAAGWGSGFLPPEFQGTSVDPQQGIRDASPPKAVSDLQRRAELDAIVKLNRDHASRVGNHAALQAEIENFQLAYRMQTAAPALFELGEEAQATTTMYGMQRKETSQVGRACLLARRMVERGVRFVQVRVGGWDAHGNLKANHRKMAERTDQPIAALLSDLKQRGLLDSTLVVWGGEFGRTPTMEGQAGGRDHSPAAYSVWLAGGGTRGGAIIGRTDAIGYTVEDRPISPQDLHATILHAIGLNAQTLTYNYHGLAESPVGVSGARPVLEAFSS